MNLYAYRLPGSRDIVTGKSAYVRRGACGSGFMVSMFGNNHDGIITIPEGERFDMNMLDKLIDRIDGEKMPARSTTREEHAAEVEAIRRAIGRGVLRKAVAARVILTPLPKLKLSEVFGIFCDRYPDAFVFCFHTRFTGTWIGASPELLLGCHNGICESMSLAGTRPAGAEGEWDAKNLEEQQVVTNFIREIYRRHADHTEESELFTKPAGPVEHLCRTIRGESCHSVGLALELSPTPALCGMPRDAAAAVISATEHFARSCYGGFCGPVASSGDLDFYVTLRCMRFGMENAAIYVGGGIMGASDPEAEWNETSRKATTMTKPLNLNIL